MTKKTIKIGGQEVVFSTSGYVPMVYRNCFAGCDIFVDVQTMKDFLAKGKQDGKLPKEVSEICERLAYAFAKHTADINGDDFPSVMEWFMQFNTFDIYWAMEDILMLWEEENATQSKQKKRTTKKQTEK